MIAAQGNWEMSEVREGGLVVRTVTVGEGSSERHSGRNGRNGRSLWSEGE